MKKRQKPVFLATLLIVFAAVALGMNMAVNPNQEHQHPEEQPKQETPIGESRKGDHSAVGKSVADAMEMKPGGAPPGQSAAKRGVPEPAYKQGTTILRPKSTVSQAKPRPNESMTSAQWYADEHGAYKDKK